MTTKALPFELSTTATTDWLQSLSQFSNVNSANQLNKVIKTLKVINADADKVLKILIQFIPTVLYISSNIESTLLSETNKTGTDKAQKIENLCIQLLGNLSLTFCSILKSQSLAADDKNQAIYIALQLIGYTLRLSSIYHQFPSQKLWEKTSELYLTAQDRGIIDQQVKHKILGLKNLPTIAVTLKRNLLFSLLCPYHYNTNEIIELYSISEKYADLLTLSTKESTESSFLWTFKQGTQPSIKKLTPEQSNTNLKINTDELLALLQSYRFSSSLDKDTLEDITHRLSGYKDTINQALPSTFNVQHLITGFNEITNYLEQIEKLNKIQKLSKQSTSPLDSPISTLLLEPMDFQKNHLESSVAPIASNSHAKLLENTKSVKIIQTINNQFIIAETDYKNCALGNITLLCSSDVNKSPVPGIIRQIKSLNPMTTIGHVLIEKIEGTVAARKISSPETLDNQIISIQHKNAKVEVLIPPSKFASGTQINLTSNNNFTLGDLVDYSPFYMRYITY
ncbi:MAG: hypothetical protein KAT04_08335 [Methylococcales bacterium]|nr:hypothetical protein [Methylococcales bacterium]